MGRWLATVAFPDGSRLFATYSSSADTLYERLYRQADVDEDALPYFRDAAVSPVDELVPVVVTTQPADDRWHALYCPRRAMVVGPGSWHHMMSLPQEVELVADPDGVRHLRTAFPPTAVARCGAPVPRDPLPFHRPPYYPGLPGPPEPEPPLVDLFASWDTGDTCRCCLLSTL